MEQQWFTMVLKVVITSVYGKTVLHLGASMYIKNVVWLDEVRVEGHDLRKISNELHKQRTVRQRN